MTTSVLTRPLLARVEHLYAQAKSANWDTIFHTLAGERELAAACSRYAKPTSGWTFLHQAAYSGNEAAARLLIRLGASLTARTKEDATPHDVAAQRGHAAVAALLTHALADGEGLWQARPEPDLLPSSCAWNEATERHACRELRVGYGGGVVVIPAGSRYFADSFGRIIIGWHGTYDPPSGMDGESMV